MNERASKETRPFFSDDFCRQFETLLRWRRDVRRFQTVPLPDGLLAQLIELADMAPSVGNSQPWRLIEVQTPELRQDIYDIFEQENASALNRYEHDKSGLYAKLKLAGLKEAPVHLAVFCERDPEQGHGLGRATMPETLAYSVVGMIQTLWLVARMHGVGLGWVSILDPQRVHQILSAPENWSFIGYLCLGFPEEEHETPELERAGWQTRTGIAGRLFSR